MESWPVPVWDVVGSGSDFAPDPVFGTVLHCHGPGGPATPTELSIDGLDIAPTGSFTASFWFRANASELVGERGFSYFQYMLSASGDDAPALRPFHPRNLHVYLPEDKSLAFGLVRTIYKDATDEYTGPWSETLIDSDGHYGTTRDLLAPVATPPAVNVTDGLWHMYTLSTQPAGSAGYRVYIDGELAGDINPSLQSLGVLAQIDGGDPAGLTGPLTLCGRSDRDPNRHFDGYLAQLAFWREALSPLDVQELFRRTAEAAASKGVDFFPAPKEPAVTPSAAPSSDASLPPGWSGPQDAARSEDAAALGQPCERTFPDDEPGYFSRGTCPGMLVCVPMQGLMSSREGQCHEAPHGGLHEPAASANVPVPLASFPLDGTLLSWPYGAWAGELYGGATFADDAVFTTALECSENTTDLAAIQRPTSWGQEGELAVSVWFKPDPAHVPRVNDTYQYLLSVGRPELGASWGPNQLHLYLPRHGHAEHGVLRAIFKDATGTDEGPSSRTYVDSDGTIGSDTPPVPKTSSPDASVDSDGLWHHAVLSTLPGRADGYSLFLDGVRVATLDNSSTPDRAQVDGGASFQPSGPIVLCTRSDGLPTRHYTGRLSSLDLFNAALGEEQVRALHESVSSKFPTLVAARRSAADGASVASRVDDETPEQAQDGLEPHDSGQTGKGGGIGWGAVVGIVLVSLIGTCVASGLVIVACRAYSARQARNDRRLPTSGAHRSAVDFYDADHAAAAGASAGVRAGGDKPDEPGVSRGHPRGGTPEDDDDTADIQREDEPRQPLAPLSSSQGREVLPTAPPLEDADLTRDHVRTDARRFRERHLAAAGSAQGARDPLSDSSDEEVPL
ncbi:unnamed protein product [Pedinophyceae sp. YPF-701]|nr:unnamed protein product [Pedinophyceae sp. YPF-701]